MAFFIEDLNMQLLFVFAATLLTISVLYPFAEKLKLVDKPGGRKQHEQHVPMIGGLAILVGSSVGCMMSQLNLYSQITFITLSTALAALGVLDDRHELRASLRLLLQFLIVLSLIISTNNQLTSLGDLFSSNPLELHRFSLPLTLIAITGVINAFNMLDGIDGLLGCTAAIILAAMGIIATKSDLVFEVIIIGTLLAALSGFLVFNFPTSLNRKRRVFLGDAGSMLLGLYVGWLGVRLTQAPLSAAKPITMVWFLALPLLDFSQVCVHRFTQGRSPLSAGRDHIHHLLMQMGCTPRQTLWILLGITITCCTVGLWVESQQWPDYYGFYGFLGLGIVYHISLSLMRRTVELPSPSHVG
jgi:UDP-GlcNAc:undecaprenyl-phosphate GlcNAc-1-phosphate transferase